MATVVKSMATAGVDGFMVEIEVSTLKGQQQMLSVIGLPDQAIKEAGERIQAAIETYPYMVDKIKKISVYSIPVERVYMIDSVPFTNYVYPGYPGKKGGYRGTVFTFNRLPRNVAELKTLMENSDGSRVGARGKKGQ